MEQYIPKSALVAEIESLKRTTFTNFDEGVNATVQTLLEVVDTLEVKEVDLNKELNDFIEEQKAWVKDDRVVEYNNGDSFNHIYDLEEIARHFYELGLKTKNRRIKL